jgi:outer membrane lipoprotein LolB
VDAPSRTPSKKTDRPLLRLATALAAVLLAAGCATERGVALPEMPGWQARQSVLAGLTDWSFTGRIGVSAGEEGFNGRLRWRQHQDEFDATLSGPLGAGAVQIEGNAGSVTIVDGDGAITRLDDPELDLKYRYGWTIPVNSLRYWALGVPDPSRPAQMNFGEDGTLSRIAQGGWIVDITQYREGGGQLMPRRIRAENPDSRVRLVIDDWVFY